MFILNHSPMLIFGSSELYERSRSNFPDVNKASYSGRRCLSSSALVSMASERRCGRNPGDVVRISFCVVVATNQQKRSYRLENKLIHLSIHFTITSRIVFKTFSLQKGNWRNSSITFTIAAFNKGYQFP